MRHEDIPPANEYERGIVIDRGKSCPPQIKSRVGGLALVRPFVRRLLNLKLPFTRLMIGSLDDTILLHLQRVPGRVTIYPHTMTHERERKEKMEEFCAQKGLEPFTEYLGFEPWSVEPVVGYIFKGSQVADLVTELLMCVFGVEPNTEFNFVLT